MRTDCKNYESRTYSGGETVRKCNLDLAPEAPWRCPDGCEGYATRLADVNWKHGELLAPPTPPEPPRLDEHAIRLLDEAEDIVNAVGPEILSDIEAAKRKRGGGSGRRLGRPREQGQGGKEPWWRRFGRRR